MSEARRTSDQRPRIRTRVVWSAGALTLLLALALAVAQGSGVTPTNTWVLLYSDRSAFAGVPIPTGAYIAAFDTQNTQCGEFTTTHAGYYGTMPCYGDDPLTSGDEGAVAGEPLSFAINGVPATPRLTSRNGTPVPIGTPATWTNNLDLLLVDLSVPPRPPVNVTLTSAQLSLNWLPAGTDIALYEVWRAETPYFAPGGAGAQQAGIVTPNEEPLSWSSGAGVGVPEVNYTYRVRSMNAHAQTVGISQAVAEFDFALAP